MLTDAVLSLARGRAEAYLTDFFAAVQAGGRAEIEARVHPALEEVGEIQVVAALLEHLVGTFGAFERLEAEGFAFEEEVGTSGRGRRYEGTYVFARGAFPLTLAFLDDLLSTVTYGDDLGEAIGEAAHLPPARRERYVRWAEQLVGAIVKGDEEAATAMLAPDLRAALAPGWVTDMIGLVAPVGPDAAVTCEGVAPAAEDEMVLETRFFCEGPEATCRFRVDFRFASLQALITGLNYDFHYRRDVLAARGAALLEALLAGRLDDAHAAFAPEMRETIPMAALAELHAFAAPYGAVAGIAPVAIEPSPEDGSRLDATYRIPCAEGELAGRASFLLTSEGARLFGAQLRPANA